MGKYNLTESLIVNNIVGLIVELCLQVLSQCNDTSNSIMRYCVLDKGPDNWIINYRKAKTRRKSRGRERKVKYAVVFYSY